MTTLAFPFEVTSSGSTATADGDQRMLQEVRFVLASTLGSRAMRPFFGSDLPSLLFENIEDSDLGFRERVTAAVQGNVEGAVVEAVRRDVDVNAGTVVVTVFVSRQQDIERQPLAVELTFGRVTGDVR